MTLLGIERSLRKANEEFFEKYSILKRDLFTKEYEFWATKFPGGNNHGPSHIKRDLENLDRLLGNNPIARGLITSYELFLAMMAVLYHDVGLLRGRKGHSDTSGDFLKQEDTNYIIDERDKEIIWAAVVSHSSVKDIEKESERFAKEEIVGEHRARPRMVAALVRLADELDEDYRRAPSRVKGKIEIGTGSLFFWEFCERIQGIRPDQQKLEILISVQFKPEDLTRTVEQDGRKRSFFRLFAEKLAKMNQERSYTSKFLPEGLRYRRIVVSVRPPA